MTVFENYFNALKKALRDDSVYDIWPDFEPQYDEHEYAWTTLRGLGEALMLDCGIGDGPPDLRHARCKECAENQGIIAKEAYQKTMGLLKEKWPALFLCRIRTE